MKKLLAAAKFECQTDKQLVKTQTIQCIIGDNLSQMAASSVNNADIFSPFRSPLAAVMKLKSF